MRFEAVVGIEQFPIAALPALPALIFRDVIEAARHENKTKPGSSSGSAAADT